MLTSWWCHVKKKQRQSHVAVWRCENQIVFGLTKMPTTNRTENNASVAISQPSESNRPSARTCLMQTPLTLLTMQITHTHLQTCKQQSEKVTNGKLWKPPHWLCFARHMTFSEWHDWPFVFDLPDNATKTGSTAWGNEVTHSTASDFPTEILGAVRPKQSMVKMLQFGQHPQQN